MEYVPAKTIVTKNKNASWFGEDYNMNIYRGCCHGCIYCDSRSDCYHVEDFDRVRAKENALAIIRDDLRRKKKTGVVGTGSMSDPYNPFEQELQLTRHALELISAYYCGVAIATKSTGVTRDVDVLREVAEYAPVLVKLTITTADDELCRKIEPYAPPTSERFAAINTLADNGIYCGVLLMPILPFINDTKENVLEIVGRAKDNGAKFVYPAFGVTLRNNQRAYFYEKLDERFPDAKQKYITRYGSAYQCSSPHAKKLYETFVEECKKLGLLYGMQEIIRNYKAGYGDGQMSLFE